MWREYRLYGISVLSEVPLGFPEQPLPGPPDVTIRLASSVWFADLTAGLPQDENTNGSYERRRAPDGAEFLRWPGLFEFMVSSDGRSIACSAHASASLESLRTYLLGQVLSFALVTQGREPLHATTVVVDGKAVALLGDSGRGKSTLAAALLKDGHRMLTDDLLLIGNDGGTFCAYPGPPRIKVFPEIAQRFLPGLRHSIRMNDATEKLIVTLAPAHVHPHAAPLYAFFVLEEPEEETAGVGIAPLTGTRPLLQLVESTFNPRVLSHERLRRQFLAVSEWAACIPVRRLTYPRTMTALAEVAHMIARDVRQAGLAPRAHADGGALGAIQQVATKMSPLPGG